MNTIRCIIADDEPIARKIVENYAQQLPQLEIVASCRDAFEVLSVLRKERVDLLFLDINMPKLSGLSLLRTLQHKPEVVITTAYQEHAIEGFELSVTDYLLKPFSLERFVQSVQKVEANIALHQGVSTASVSEAASSPSKDHLFVKVDRQLQRVNLCDITHVDAYGNYIKIHRQTGGMLLSLQSLSDFLAQLPERDFVRIHKSHLVRFDKIDALEGLRVKIGEKWIPIGKVYKAVLLARMNS